MIYVCKCGKMKNGGTTQRRSAIFATFVCERCQTQRYRRTVNKFGYRIKTVHVSSLKLVRVA